MRRIEIVEEPNQTYKWTAIDQDTRQSLLRLSDLYQLHDVCDRLEWKVVDVKRRRQNSGAISRPRRAGLSRPPADDEL
jgi:hypothetical protein